MKPSTIKYYKLNIELTTGFKYSVFCGARQLEGMKKSSDGYWTKRIEVIETTEEDYRKAWWDEKEVSSEEAPKKKSGKTKLPKFSSLEDFFGEEDAESTVKQGTRKRKNARKEN